MQYYVINKKYSPTEIDEVIVYYGGYNSENSALLSEAKSVVAYSAAETANNISTLVAKSGNKIAAENWTATLQGAAAVGTLIPTPFTVVAGLFSGVASTFTSKQAATVRAGWNTQIERLTVELQEYGELEKKLTPVTTLPKISKTTTSSIITYLIILIIIILILKWIL